MSYTKGNSSSSDPPRSRLSSTRFHMPDSPMTPSRSTSPSSSSLQRTSSASTSPGESETQQDLISASSSRFTLDLSPSTSPSLRQGSNDSCDEHACSKCRLSEEEHRRIKAERRKEQNRASQRRFRAKKENEIRGAADQVSSLESLIQDLQKHNAELGQTNVLLMARLAELENQRSYNYSETQSEGTTQCQHCHKLVLSDPSTDVIDYLWSVENTELQHTGQIGTYLPLFDHEYNMTFEV